MVNNRGKLDEKRGKRTKTNSVDRKRMVYRKKLSKTETWDRYQSFRLCPPLGLTPVKQEVTYSKIQHSSGCLSVALLNMTNSEGGRNKYSKVAGGDYSAPKPH